MIAARSAPELSEERGGVLDVARAEAFREPAIGSQLFAAMTGG